MTPIFFKDSVIEIPSYLMMIMLGFFAAIAISRRDAKRGGLDCVAIVDLGILMLFLGIAGARLFAVLTDGLLLDFVHLCTNSTLVDAPNAASRLCSQDTDCGFDYMCNLDIKPEVTSGSRNSMCYPPRDCLAALKFWQGGLTFYGGLLLAGPGGFWFAHRRGLGPRRTADLVAPSLMLGLSIGRIGCFLNGCCYGIRSSSALAIRFPGHSFNRHATQLYESVFAFGLFLFLRYFLRPRYPNDGQLFGWMLLLYGSFRIAIELYRDDVRGGLLIFSTSQIISVPLIVLGAALVYLGHSRAVD